MTLDEPLMAYANVGMNGGLHHKPSSHALQYSQLHRLNKKRCNFTTYLLVSTTRNL